MPRSAVISVESSKGLTYAGLRSRLVSKLTGLSRRQLGYWHATGLLIATLRPGERGTPRLYSWADYLRLQLASELHEQPGVTTLRIRHAVEFLDRHFPDWYYLPDPLRADTKGHILATVVNGSSPLLADRAGQHVFPWPDEMRDFGNRVVVALETIEARGSLCRLDSFADAVLMSPRINLAQPTVAGTALETEFVTQMAREIGLNSAARIYRLEPRVLRRAIEFEEAVA